MSAGYRRPSSMMFICALVLSVLLSGVSAAAQDQTASPEADDTSAPIFGVNPVGDYPNGYFEVTLEPGASTVLTARVTNIGVVDVELRAFPADALNPPNGGFSAANEPDERTGATTWVSVDSSEFLVVPEASQDISIEIAIPEDAAPGQWVTSMVVSTSKALPAQGGGMFNQIIRGAVPIVITIPGEITPGFELGEPTIVRTTESLELSIPVSNTGNILVKPAGQLTITGPDGTVVADAKVEMGSVYAGNDSSILVLTPAQTPPGEYQVSLNLTDQATSASASFEGMAVTIEEVPGTSAISVVSSSVKPNADEIVFANVTAVVSNSGDQLPATNVDLSILRDGELVDTHPLATNQVMLNGDNSYTSIYVPGSGSWEPGTYTFKIVISSVDPNGGQKVELLSTDLPDQIVVP